MTRTVHHAGAVWTLSPRPPSSMPAADDLAAAQMRRPMTLVLIESSAGHRATQALRVGELEAMSDEDLVRLITDVLKARERE